MSCNCLPPLFLRLGMQSKPSVLFHSYSTSLTDVFILLHEQPCSDVIACAPRPLILSIVVPALSVLALRPSFFSPTNNVVQRPAAGPTRLRAGVQPRWERSRGCLAFLVSRRRASCCCNWPHERRASERSLLTLDETQLATACVAGTDHPSPPAG